MVSAFGFSFWNQPDVVVTATRPGGSMASNENAWNGTREQSGMTIVPCKTMPLEDAVPRRQRDFHPAGITIQIIPGSSVFADLAVDQPPPLAQRPGLAFEFQHEPTRARRLVGGPADRNASQVTEQQRPNATV
jgi:hypothetical protein